MMKRKYLILWLAIFALLPTQYLAAQRDFQLCYPNNDALTMGDDSTFVFVWNDTALLFAPYTFTLIKEYKTTSTQYDTILQLENIHNYYLNYPWNAPSISEGNYRWQIASDSFAQIFSASFRIQNPLRVIRLKHNYYMDLKTKMDGSYQMAYDKKLFVHYDENYAVDTNNYLCFRILSNKMDTLVTTDNDGNIAPAYHVPTVPISYGDNRLIINLESCPPIHYGEFYRLEVWNRKGDVSFIRFQPAIGGIIIMETVHINPLIYVQRCRADW